MTTRVFVSNTGPDRINVKEINDDGQTGSINNHYLRPGEFVEVYVHQSQKLEVTEEGQDGG